MNKKKPNNAVIEINLTDRGSSGTIMNAASEGALSNKNTEVYKIIPQGQSEPNTYCFANSESKALSLFKEIYYKAHSYKPIDGTYFNFYTRKVIRFINKVYSSHAKTIIHIHNIHHSQLNIFRLLSFLVKKKIGVVITIHDAWLYTGGCYCYDHVKCDEWKKQCGYCKYGYKYSKT